MISMYMKYAKFLNNIEINYDLILIEKYYTLQNSLFDYSQAIKKNFKNRYLNKKKHKKRDSKSCENHANLLISSSDSEGTKMKKSVGTGIIDLFSFPQ